VFVGLHTAAVAHAKHTPHTTLHHASPRARAARAPATRCGCAARQRRPGAPCGSRCTASASPAQAWAALSACRRCGRVALCGCVLVWSRGRVLARKRRVCQQARPAAPSPHTTTQPAHTRRHANARKRARSWRARWAAPPARCQCRRCWRTWRSTWAPWACLASSSAATGRCVAVVARLRLVCVVCAVSRTAAAQR
jgi:hypothetical protein